jgi:hypothetical protein
MTISDLIMTFVERCKTAICLAYILTGLAFGAPDDFDEQPTSQPVPNGQFNVMNINVEQQIFQQHGSEKSARDELKNSLQLQIEAIDQLCDLDETQKAKLLLAAEGDLARFFGTVSELRQKYSQVKNDGNAWNDFWQRVQPLQAKYNLGLFQENSLFEKTLHSTLNENQLREYSEFSKERKRRFFRTQCELVVMEFERALPLRADQRQRLITVLSEEGKRFTNPGEIPQVYWILRIPEAKLRPLFEDWQWKKLEPQFRQLNPRPIINNRNILNIFPIRRQ